MSTTAAPPITIKRPYGLGRRAKAELRRRLRLKPISPKVPRVHDVANGRGSPQNVASFQPAPNADRLNHESGAKQRFQ
jgi:hypothetical protein